MQTQYIFVLLVSVACDRQGLRLNLKFIIKIHLNEENELWTLN